MWAYFFGYLPIWVSLLLQFLTRGPSLFPIYGAQQIDNGSTFLVSAAMFSSYTYVLMNDDQESQSGPFPHKNAFLIIFLGMLLAWALVMGVQTLSSSLPNAISLNVTSVRLLTYVSLVVSLISLYLLFVYRNAVKPGYGTISREDTEQFKHDWMERDD
jgi:hypothetical protein